MIQYWFERAEFKIAGGKKLNINRESFAEIEIKWTNGIFQIEKNIMPAKLGNFIY